MGPDDDVHSGPQLARVGRALGLMAASVVVIGIAGLSYINPRVDVGAGVQSAPTPAAALYHLVAIDFVSPSTGWVLAEGDAHDFAILRTADSGTTWSRQLAGQAGPIGEYMQFFDPSNGVLVVLGSDGPMFKTGDGGKTWTRSAIPKEGADLVSVTSVAFVDRDAGWLLADVPGRQQLYRTTDGGRTWTSLGNPVAETDTAYGVVFADRDRGWLYTRSIGAYAYGTTDGGASWVRAELPAPAGGWPVAPKGATLPEQFFVTARPTHGDGVVASVIPVAPPEGRSGGGGTVMGYPPLTVHRFDGGRDITYVYRTAGDMNPSRFSALGSSAKPGPVVTTEAQEEVLLSSLDGGQTWQPITAPASGAVGFLDTLNWWWIGSGAWSKTSDGGRTWTKVRTIGVPEPLPGSLHLLDGAHAWFGAMAGTRPLLESTADGGLHWTMSFLPPSS